MMDPVTRAAFADELEKISGLKTWLHEGWHGTADAPFTWGGQGKYTKYLPIGAKSFTALGVAQGLPSALSKTDPSGRERGRLERLSSLAGNTIGGLIGGAAALRTGFGRKHTIIGPMLGSMAGSIVGDRAASLPFALKRRLTRQPQSQQMQPSVNDHNSLAPGGAHSPAAVEGQAQRL